MTGTEQQRRIPDPIEEAGARQDASARQRARYAKPRLVAYGNVRDVTLGGSPGGGDSGGAFIQFPP